MMRLFVLLLSLSAAACAQTTPVRTAPPAPALPPAPTPPPAAHAGDTRADRTEVEDAVQATISRPGVHVVHLWAPWCGNSRAELEAGLYEVVEDHPEVTFSFVSIWNDARDGAAMLARYGITPSDDGRVTVRAQPDRGPSADRAQRRRSFLDLPLTWTPTTWVFNREGQLAYAFNYGEVSPEMLALAIAHATDDWTHD